MFEPRMADVNWSHGSLITPATPDEPPGLDDGSAAALLDEAEDYLNEVGGRIRAEHEAEVARRRQPRWKRWFGRS